MIKTSLDPRGLPLAIEPDDGCPGFESLLHERRDFFSEKLLEHGALLFRGFAEPDLEQFRRFVAAFSGSETLFDYAGGASPRSALGGEKDGLYSSTEYPSSMGLALHNELSYADVYPKRLFFFCLVAAEQGGETTLGDSRRILRRIDPGIVDAFRTRRVRYVRNLSPDQGSGYSWQDAFETDDPQVAESHCRRIGAEFEWGEGGMLRLSQVRPGIAAHPATGDEVWFNQADGFHPSALDPATYAAFLDQTGSEDRFRLNVTYGDGSPIEAATLDHIRAALREETVPHRWRTGDILVLDNLLAAHGRMPFSGARKIALAMT
ncbi:MAG: SyrP-like protein [uncultured Sphingosinicella sp.]|uniref:SyrP-like protein n=1 Tax=uncultured Sphingosinicella sp. TaxID=478748 RepID=A0A6J4UEU6_9SPHN|nr:TauD/TfdA family dioxygenase [uncultured Sphingosinicella sp.]CAA9545626.1 MAG: SyrP-like protein [uncultured Sphingosinicella sp.]